jgi:hypothetical protein
MPANPNAIFEMGRSGRIKLQEVHCQETLNGRRYIKMEKPLNVADEPETTPW